jgi:ABC-type transport system involved in multi-copper enzyme maturation permease subunit
MRFEMVRLFNTKRGLLALLTFATIWFIMLYYFVGSAAAIVTSASFESMAANLFGVLGVSALLDWSVSEFAIYWLIAVYFFPIFAVVVCSDQICSDKQRGTLRFITLRCTRLELILGRYLGQLSIVLILILLTIIATSILASVRDITLLSASLIIGTKLSLELLIVVMPFIALMSLLNTVVSSAKLATVTATLFFALGPLIVTFIKYQFGQEFYLSLIFPGGQIDSMLSQSGLNGSHYILPLIQTFAFLVCSHFVMKRASI